MTDDARIPFLGVLNGPDLPLDQLAELMLRADFVVAADGAAARCLAAGRTPDVAIGDLDSLPREVWDQLPLVIAIEDQERTDAQKLLDYAAENGYQFILLTGIEGDLPDHSLAAWGACAQSVLAIEVAVRRGSAWIVRDRLSVAARIGARISLLPLMPCASVSLSGVEWPVSGVPMSLGTAFSISNRAVEPVITVEITGGVAILFALRDEKSP